LTLVQIDPGWCPATDKTPLEAIDGQLE